MPQRIAHYNTSVNSSAGGTGNNLSSGRPQWDVDFQGMLLGIRLDYHASAAAGTDVVISEPYGLQRTILTRTNANADATFTPQSAVMDTTGTAIASSYTPFYVESSNLQVAVAETGGALTRAVVVTVLILEES